MFFVGMLFFKGVLLSMAGPTPNYAIQHILSTRSPREAALENMVMAMVSLAPRFLLIAAIAVLGIVFYSHDLAAMGPNVDFEKILPNVLRDYVPIGFKGILIAALLASFMSTFVSTVNSGAAYVVNDIYKRYINPDAPPKRYVVIAWITSSAMILLGIVFGLFTDSVHKVTEWIVSALCAGVRRAQRAEMALVAVQRLRLLRRDGRRDGRRDPQALRRRPPGLRRS